MTMLFIGGEDTDFDLLTNNTTFRTDGGFRSSYARCAVFMLKDDCQAVASFSAPSASFWVGMQHQAELDLYSADWRTALTLTDGRNPRLLVQMRSDRYVRLVSVGANAAQTTLATTTSAAIQNTGPNKIDYNITYGVGGRFRMYVSGVLAFEYSGDLTAGGSTALDGLILSAPALGTSPTRGFNFSEILVAERDTRTLSVKTHSPIATGTGHAWLGSQTDVNEIVLNTGNLISTTAAETEALFTISPLPSGNFGVRAVKVVSHAARGETGPQGLQIGVKNGSTVSYNPTRPLDTGYKTLSETFEVNPASNTPWSISDLTSLQIAAKSKA